MSNAAVITTAMVMLLGCVLLSVFKKVDIGIPALACAFFLCITLMGQRYSVVLSYYPLMLLYLVAAGGIFYGFAVKNGTMDKIARWFIYGCCKIGGWFLPIALFLMGAIISGSGAGAVPALLMTAVVGMAVQKDAKMNPILVATAAAFGPQIGDLCTWSSGAGMKTPYLLAVWSDEAVVASQLKTVMATGQVYFLFLFVISYIIFKGWKTQNVVSEKPEPFTPLQKKNAIVLLISAVIVVIPGFIQLVAPNAVTQWITKRLDIYVVIAVGILVCWALKLGDVNNILKTQVAWGMIFMLIGTTGLVGLATSAGVADYLAALVGDLPMWVIPGILGLVGGVLSFFSGFVVVYPLLLPMIPALAALGANPVACLTAVICTTNATALCPFSTCGALCLANYSNEDDRARVIPKQLVYTIFICLISAVYCCLPICNLFLSSW